MFKEYGGTPIPKGSINGDQLRRYVMEARECYGLMNNTNISDEEIAQALYKHTNELGKGSAAINSQGEPQLLFRGDTKSYDLRIPRNWADPNIFRIVVPIGISLPFLNNFRNKIYEK